MGTYVVTELECPGYIVDETQRIIHLHANDAPQFVFTNTNSAGEIVVFDLDPGVFSMVETAMLTEPLALRSGEHTDCLVMRAVFPQRHITSEADFKRGVDPYIEFYNCRHPHRTLRNQTPCQAEEKARNHKA